MNNMLPLFILIVPVVGAVVLFINLKVNSNLVYIISCLGSVLLSLYAFSINGLNNFHTLFSINWISVVGINISFGLDYYSLTLILLTSIIFLGNHFFSNEGIIDKNKITPWLLLMQSFIFGVFMASDIFVFYIFWELVMIPLLIIFFINQQRKIAIYIFIYTLAGSLLMFIGFVFLYFKVTSISNGEIISTDYIYWKDVLFSENKSILTHFQSSIWWILIGISMAIKTPLFIFHGWQPISYIKAPTKITVLMAAIISKMGIYAFIRIGWGILGEPPEFITQSVIIISLIGVLYGALVAWQSTSTKAVISYASLSHMNMMVFGVFVGSTISWQGVMFLTVQHGLIISGLFWIANIIKEQSKGGQVSGLFKSSPIIAGIFTVLSLANIGFPGLSGFVGEFTILLGAISNHITTTFIMAIVVIFSAMYQLKLLKNICFGTAVSSYIKNRDAVLNKTTLLILSLLVISLIYFGILPNYLFSLFVEIKP